MTEWTPPPEQPHNCRVGFCYNNIEYHSWLMPLNQAENERYEIEELIDATAWITEQRNPTEIERIFQDYGHMKEQVVSCREFVRLFDRRDGQENAMKRAKRAAELANEEVLNEET